MNDAELIAQNTAIRKSMADTAGLLDKAYGASGERLELRVARLIRIEAKLRAERDALGAAAKTLQRVQFILGGHSDTIEDCDEGGLRLNIERALALMRATLPIIKAALEERTAQ